MSKPIKIANPYGSKRATGAAAAFGRIPTKMRPPYVTKVLYVGHNDDNRSRDCICAATHRLKDVEAFELRML